MPSEYAFEAQGFERSSSAEETAGGITELGGCDIGCNIQRVGDHDEDGIAGVFRNVAHNLTDYVDILPGQNQPVQDTAWLDTGAGSTDDDISIPCFFETS